MSHYETLGVAESATPEELKAAFRSLAKKHHPDVGGDQSKFQQINEAYTTLSDPNSRAHYDHTRRNPPHNPFNHNPYAQAQHREFHFNFGGGPDPMSAFHDQFFSQFGFNVRQQPKNRNIRVNIELDFLETLNQQTKVIEFKTTNNIDTLQLQIPAGIENGNIFTLAGRGDDANTAIPRGNLEVHIHVRQHDRFLRNGENIVEEITIDCFEAITGCRIPVSLPSGKTIELNVPRGTQHQSQFGITDEGFPRQNGTRGKYIAKINIRIPTLLTAKQLELIEEIQKIRPINA